jgi:hypothetical protein
MAVLMWDAASPQYRERRVKYLYIARETLVSMLRIDARSGRVYVFDGMPEDARIVGVHDCEETDEIRLTVESESFPVIPAGRCIPRFDVNVTAYHAYPSSLNDRLARYRELIGDGQLTVNRCRELEGLPPIVGGDAIIVEKSQ